MLTATNWRTEEYQYNDILNATWAHLYLLFALLQLSYSGKSWIIIETKLNKLYRQSSQLEYRFQGLSSTVTTISEYSDLNNPSIDISNIYFCNYKY